MLWQSITYENDFKKDKIYIALNSAMRFTTQFKDTLTNYTKSYSLTKKLVLLPVEWVKNGLLFTKRLHVLNKIL